MAADPYEYLQMERFTGDAAAGRALLAALRMGWIDLLRGGAALAELREAGGCDEPGAELLTAVLMANSVVHGEAERLLLTPEFLRILPYRDLLEVKLEFAVLAGQDLLEHFEALISAPADLLRASRTFRLFAYDRCFEGTSENIAWTRRWMRITTLLTRYEGRVCTAEYDFGSHRRMLDIGGNSGEFALAACRAAPALQATVLDLPLVCDIGREHVDQFPEGARIDFVKASGLAAPLPGGYDLITFKSMLHDWPEEGVAEFLQRAAAALAPGGVLLIFERSRWEPLPSPLPFTAVPFFLFARGLRTPEWYAGQLQAAGLVLQVSQRLALDWPFLLVAARKEAV